MAELSKTEKNLLVAFMGEAEANRKYTAYAMKAMEEGHPEVAQIFLEAAGAETIHALGHLKAMGVVRTTHENLKTVVEMEASDESMYAAMIREAQAEGREDAMGSFRVAMEREVHHRQMFEEALRQFTQKLQSQGARPVSVGPSVQPQVASPPTAASLRSPEHQAREDLGKERERVARRANIREVVFGMQDGLISTATLVAGVYAATAGAASERSFVLIAGLAGALAGTFSMAAGAYLSSKAEREVYLAEVERERSEIELHPAEEVAELVALYQRAGLSQVRASELATKAGSSRELLLEALSAHELGILSAQLQINPARDALVMGIAYFFGGFLPIVPFLLTGGRGALFTALAITVVGLFGLGVGKAVVGQKRIWLSGLEVTAIGVLVALVGYLFGTVLPRILGLEF